jgi:hypothetical protein
MIEGQIKKIDLSQRTVTITTQDNQELMLTFPDGANIEVHEPTTMGTMGGELEDLREGYFVELELGAHDAEGKCACASLICIS